MNYFITGILFTVAYKLRCFVFRLFEEEFLMTVFELLLIERTIWLKECRYSEWKHVGIFFFIPASVLLYLLFFKSKKSLALSFFGGRFTNNFLILHPYAVCSLLIAHCSVHSNFSVLTSKLCPLSCFHGVQDYIEPLVLSFTFARFY